MREREVEMFKQEERDENYPNNPDNEFKSLLLRRT
jgi:hypothetical protein